MANEIESIAISNGDSTNHIQVSVVPISWDATKNGLVVCNADWTAI